MDRDWIRILAAAALLVLLPQLTIHIGSKLHAAPPEPSETMSATDETEQTETTEATEPTESTEPSQTDGQAQERMKIPVLTADGTVKAMDLEDYVRGVVLAEMPASFEAEALKAQAVAARTYTLRVLTTGGRHEGSAICTESTCCQAYLSDEDYLSKRGTETDWKKVSRAVADTAALVLTYNGSLIDATYFSCSGGRTEDAVAVWGSEVPYLQAVDSPGEEGATVYETEAYFTKSEFARLLSRDLAGSPTQWLGKVTRTDGGGVATMVIGGVTYTGKELRSLLGLNSTAFTMTADASGISVVTKGNGHRVGMSQYGAEAMAVQGSTYDEILTHYYQGTVIDKFSGLG